MKRFTLCLLPVMVGMTFLALPAPAQNDGDELKIGKYRTLHSDILNKDRVVLVSLPDGYDQGSRVYPVIIKLFGTPADYFSHMTSTLNMLSSEGTIPPCIFIGVDQHGHGEVIPPSVPATQYQNEGDKFLDFMKKELIPFIERNYRTNGFRIFMGSFECGVMGLYTLLNDPDLFNVYLVNTPGRYGNSTRYLATVRDSIGSMRFSNRYLHITNTDQESPDLTGPIADLASYIRTEAPEGLHFSYSVLAGAEFDGLTPYFYCKGPVTRIFDGYVCPPDIYQEGSEALSGYYEKLSDKLGYPVAIPERVLDNSGNALWQAGKLEEAEKTFLMMIENYPASANGYFRMGDLTRTMGRFEEAISWYKKCLERMPNIDIFKIRLQQAEKLLQESKRFP